MNNNNYANQHTNSGIGANAGGALQGRPLINQAALLGQKAPKIMGSGPPQFEASNLMNATHTMGFQGNHHNG